MTNLPDDVAVALVRGIGTYIRELPPQELPANLRRFRSFRPQALNAHQATLLKVLDDDASRARIGHWLDKDKPPLSKQDARLLAIATAREDGWEDALRASGTTRERPASKSPSTESKIEAERDKTRRAKEDLKKARDELKAVQQQGRATIGDLESQIRDLQSRLHRAEQAAAAARKEAERAIERADRAERKAKSADEKLQQARDEARKEARDLRKQLAPRAEPRKEPARATPAPKKKEEPKVRRKLRVPKGRLEDDPETLEGWLERDDVTLMIDGYNVAKADGGYEDLQLESQRERLFDSVFRLAKMTDTETVIVFDAQRVPGRRARKSKRPVTVEWSKEGEIADDYIIGRLEQLPNHPVIVVTNDKELQERARKLHATIATSQQLLRLLR